MIGDLSSFLNVENMSYVFRNITFKKYNCSTSVEKWGCVTIILLQTLYQLKIHRSSDFLHPRNTIISFIWPVGKSFRMLNALFNAKEIYRLKNKGCIKPGSDSWIVYDLIPTLRNRKYLVQTSKAVGDFWLKPKLIAPIYSMDFRRKCQISVRQIDWCIVMEPFLSRHV